MSRLGVTEAQTGAVAAGVEQSCSEAALPRGPGCLGVRSGLCCERQVAVGRLPPRWRPGGKADSPADADLHMGCNGLQGQEEIQRTPSWQLGPNGRGLGRCRHLNLWGARPQAQLATAGLRGGASGGSRAASPALGTACLRC